MCLFCIELEDEFVTEVRTWFCVSKTDEARRVKKNSIENAVFSQSGEQSVIAIRTRGTNPVGYAFRQKSEGRL